MPALCRGGPRVRPSCRPQGATILSVILEPFVRVPLTEPEEEDTGVRPYRWTVEEFYRFIEAGIFEHPERLELIRGEIIEKMAAQRTPHSQSTVHTIKAMARAFGESCHVRSQLPLDIGKESEPEPDVMVLRGDERDYDDHTPTPSEVQLIIEISDTTLRSDTGSKAALYAEARIQEYWVLNLNARCLELHRDPIPMQDSRYGFGYKTRVRYTEEEAVSPLAAPQAEIRVSDLLPRVTPEEGRSA